MEHRSRRERGALAASVLALTFIITVAVVRARKETRDNPRSTGNTVESSSAVLPAVSSIAPPTVAPPTIADDNRSSDTESPQAQGSIDVAMETVDTLVDPTTSSSPASSSLPLRDEPADLGARAPAVTKKPEAELSETKPVGVRSRIPEVREIEGTVTAISLAGPSLELKTDDGETEKFPVTDGTPVFYGGEQYRIRNLEVGDRVRLAIDPDSGRVRIQVLESKPVEAPTSQPKKREFEGTVTAISFAGPTLEVTTDDGRREIFAVTSRTPVFYRGEQYRISNLEVGDRVQLAIDLDSGGVRIQVLQSTRRR